MKIIPAQSTENSKVPPLMVATVTPQTGPTFDMHGGLPQFPKVLEHGSLTILPIRVSNFIQAGKSLYTTIRELVENSLDAAESIGVLPLVSLTVEEFTEEEFNEQRGMDNRDVVDEELFKVHDDSE